MIRVREIVSDMKHNVNLVQLHIILTTSLNTTQTKGKKAKHDLIKFFVGLGDFYLPQRRHHRDLLTMALRIKGKDNKNE